MFLFHRKKKFKKELLRKLFHLLELPILAGYSAVAIYFGPKTGYLALTALLIILLEVEYIRLEYKLRLPEMIDILRRHERDHVAGSIFFVVATIICFAAFDYTIAMIALLMTVFGDLSSALIGIRFGKRKIYKNKTLEGFVAGLIVNLMIGLIFLPWQPQVAVVMAVAASCVELWTGKLDDNLTVPIAAGFLGQFLIFILQIDLSAFPGPILGKLFNLGL